MTTTTSESRLEAKLTIEPIPCPRPRIALRGRFPTAYYPKPYQEWKEEAQELVEAIIASAGQETFPLQGPLFLEARFYVSKARTSKLLWPKGDIDNFLKSLMDAATKAGLWEDDDQIVTCHSAKRFVPHTEDGFIELTVTPEIIK